MKLRHFDLWRQQGYIRRRYMDTRPTRALEVFDQATLPRYRTPFIAPRGDRMRQRAATCGGKASLDDLQFHGAANAMYPHMPRSSEPQPTVYGHIVVGTPARVQNLIRQPDTLAVFTALPRTPLRHTCQRTIECGAIETRIPSLDTGRRGGGIGKLRIFLGAVAEHRRIPAPRREQ